MGHSALQCCLCGNWQGSSHQSLQPSATPVTWRLISDRGAVCQKRLPNFPRDAIFCLAALSAAHTGAAAPRGPSPPSMEPGGGPGVPPESPRQRPGGRAAVLGRCCTPHPPAALPHAACSKPIVFHAKDRRFPRHPITSSPQFAQIAGRGPHEHGTQAGAYPKRRLFGKCKGQEGDSWALWAPQGGKSSPPPLLTHYSSPQMHVFSLRYLPVLTSLCLSSL